VNPSDYDALHNFGVHYAWKDDPRRAIYYYRKASRLNPNAVLTLVAIASRHLDTGRLRAARRYAVRAKELNKSEVPNIDDLLTEIDEQAERTNS